MDSLHHQNLKQELIEQGINLINEEGSANLSLRRLARLTHVSEAAPYKHFANKEELLFAIQNYIKNQFMEVLNLTIEKNINKKEILLEMGIAYINFFKDNPSFYKFCFFSKEVYIDLSSLDDKLSYEPFILFKKVAYEALKEKMDEEQIRIKVIQMFSLVHGLAYIASSSKSNQTFNWKEDLKKVLCEG